MIVKLAVETLKRSMISSTLRYFPEEKEEEEEEEKKKEEEKWSERKRKEERWRGKNGGWREKKGRWEVGKESNEQLAKEGKIVRIGCIYIHIYIYTFASRVSISR